MEAKGEELGNQEVESVDEPKAAVPGFGKHIKATKPLS